MSDLEKTGPIPPMNLSDMEKTGPVNLSARSDMDKTGPVNLSARSDMDKTGPINLSARSEMEKTGPVALSARSEMDKTGPIPSMSEMHKTGPVQAMNKTSSVPLKKETVRVTLKANPEAPRAEAPNVEGAAPAAAGPPAPPRPPVVASPAPTIRLKTAGGGVTGTPAPAPTVRLNTGTNLAGAPTVPLQTRPMTAAAPSKGSTVQLPKATVQINPTRPLGPPSAPGSAKIGTMHVVDDEETERLHKEATTISILSVFAFVASVALLAAQIMTWTGADTAAKLIGDLIN